MSRSASHPVGSGPALLLGGGPLSRELAIAAQRLGLAVVVAADDAMAPAMQVAHRREVVPLDDRTAVAGVVRTHDPAIILPASHRLDLDGLAELEAEGFRVASGIRAARVAASRGAMRELAGEEPAVLAPRHAVASSEADLREVCDELGYPCVVKPLASHLKQGMTVVKGPARVETAWSYARENGSGGGNQVLAEEYVEFETEVTLPTVRSGEGDVRFLDPVGHRQEGTAHREAWMPVGVAADRLEEMRAFAAALVGRMGEPGLYSVEFFLTGERALFSEIRPGPHVSGLLSLASGEISHFELHLRAVMDLPVRDPGASGPVASAVISGRSDGRAVRFEGLRRSLEVATAQVLLFAGGRSGGIEPSGVAMARGADVDEARARALEAASRIDVITG